MSTLPGLGGGDADDLIDTAFALDDDLDITLLDDVVGEVANPSPLRGQNEDAGDDASREDGDYDDPRFQERLTQERRRADDIEARALADQERTEAALVEAEKRSIASQRDSFKLALDSVDVRLRTMTEALIYARQEDDYASQTNLEGQIAELRKIRSEIETNQGRLPSEQAIDSDFRRHILQRRQQYNSARTQDDTPRALNAKASQWQSANKWMTDPAKKVEKTALIEVNNSLVAEGYDANSDDFFSELSRRMAKRFPSLNVKALNAAPVGQQARQPAGNRGTPPVGGGRSSAPPSPQAKAQRGKVDINGDDIAMMKRLRIDPSDKQAVQRFAKEKYSRLQSENARR
jgi:hypothetical protein